MTSAAPSLPLDTVRSFREKILNHYRSYGRSMPWREDTSPYSIFISEIMLQQTQVSRVEQYYRRFISRFPDFCSLAEIPLDDLLAEWKGLGYNRRARFLRESARIICGEFNGKLPAETDELVKLPGIGPNTAGSISAFAFNLPVVFIETNIRRVFIREFFPEEEGVHDREILPLIEQTLPEGNSRVWYWALMDYGVALKSEGRQANRRSRHHSVQSRFEGSRRQLRGEILRQLGGNPAAAGELEARLRERLPEHPFDSEYLRRILMDLASEGFLAADESGRYRIGD